MDRAILVAGSINEDLVLRVAQLPRPGETVVASDVSVRQGGKGANQALALSKLGAPVQLWGSVGRDDPGDRTQSSLKRLGVDTVLSVSERPTGQAVVLVDDDGSNLIVVHRGANEDDYADAIAQHGSRFYALIAQCETDQSVVLRAMRSFGGLKVLNASPSSRVPDELLEVANLVVVNEEEFRDLNTELSRHPSVVVTRGSSGASWVTHGSVTHTSESPRVRVVDSTGAGDAFLAALVVSLCADTDKALALRIACFAGAMTCTGVGAQTALPTRAALEAFLSEPGKESR